MKIYRLGRLTCYSPQDWKTDHQPGWRHPAVIVSLILIMAGVLNACLP